MNPVEDYILKQNEPFQSLMLYVRSVIQRTIPEIEEKFSYRIPFYHYGKKPMIYLNVLKGTDYLDVAFIQGIQLESDYPELKDYNSRKKVRSIQIKNIEDFDELQFVKLLHSASAISAKSRSAWKS